MENKGVSEQELINELIGKDNNSKVNKGEKFQLDPEKIKMNDKLTKEFTKVMDDIQENADEEKLKAFNEKIM